MSNADRGISYGKNICVVKMKKTSACAVIKPPAFTWTKANALAAQRQGWDLFDYGFRCELSQLIGAWFTSEAEVVTYCIRRAMGGDPLCTKALLLCSLRDPHWMAAAYTDQAKRRLLVVRGAAPCSEVSFHTHPSKKEIV